LRFFESPSSFFLLLSFLDFLFLLLSSELDSELDSEAEDDRFLCLRLLFFDWRGERGRREEGGGRREEGVGREGEGEEDERFLCLLFFD
jgi:hypothetical protein